MPLTPILPPPDALPRDDGMVFHGSPESTLGVEIELQIIDPHTGDLAPGSPRILKACEEEGLRQVSAELMQSMIEVKTDICASAQEVKDQLTPTLRRLRNIAQSLGYQLALGATHPFNRGLSGVVFPAERYERIRARLAWLTYQRVVFGLHVHVGVPSGDLALGLCSMLTRYLPHLLALSSSSPFWHGEDTGLASCRSALYGMLPHSGVPHYFRKWKDFRAYCRVLRDAHAIRSPKDIYWDIRPVPDLGTIEIRVCDMPCSLNTTFGLVAMIHALAVSTQRLLLQRPQLVRGDLRRHWLAVENKWLATRYGLDAVYIRTASGKRRLLSQDLKEVVERLKPIAQERGDAPFLKYVTPGENYETGAKRLRRIFRETGDWKALVNDMCQRWAEELPPAA